MKDFYDLPEEMGNRILARLIVAVKSAKVPSIEELAAKNGQTLEETWASLCEDSGALHYPASGYGHRRERLIFSAPMTQCSAGRALVKMSLNELKWAAEARCRAC